MNKYVCHRICQNCHEPFLPDWRNRKRQKFCPKIQCRKASAKFSFEKWLKKHPGHYKGNACVLRVRQWREKHPNYSKRTKAETNVATTTSIVNCKVKAEFSAGSAAETEVSLHNIIMRNPLIIGMVADIYGVALPNIIVRTQKRLINLGVKIQSRIPGRQSKHC